MATFFVFWEEWGMNDVDGDLLVLFIYIYFL